MKITLPPSKRFRFALYAFHMMIIVGLLGAKWGVDLNALAVYMGVTCIPIVAYILGETFKPSINQNSQNNENRT